VACWELAGLATPASGAFNGGTFPARDMTRLVARERVATVAVLTQAVPTPTRHASLRRGEEHARTLGWTDGLTGAGVKLEEIAFFAASIVRF